MKIVTAQMDNGFSTLLFIAPDSFDEVKWFESRKQYASILGITKILVEIRSD